jgi:hypothetical protein
VNKERESEHSNDDSSQDKDPQQGYYHNIIPDLEEESIVNVFCFGAFADNKTGVMYNDCTRNPIHVVGWKHVFPGHVPL